MLFAVHVDYNSATVMGITYGILHAVGPDHLGTLMALSVANPPKQAFSVGAAWSLGHCVGMIVVAGTVMLFQRASSFDIELWEHLGDYVIGISMIVCGLYFLVYESNHIEEHADGSVSLKQCACHGHKGAHVCITSTLDRRRREKGRPRGKLNLCQDFAQGVGSSSAPPAFADEGGVDACEDTPLLPSSVVAVESTPKDINQDWFMLSERDVKSALLGVFQGLCCPMSLMGIAFLATLPSLGIIVFVVVFLFASAVFTGGLAAAWSWLVTNQVVTSAVPTQVLYRASCAFTIALGAVWVAANYLGVLDKLNYAEHKQQGLLKMEVTLLPRH